MSFYREKVFPRLAEALWLLFLFLDLTRMADSTPVKFAAICLCLVTALLGAESPDAGLVALALCFTVGADWFLLVRNDHYLLGTGLFRVVQLLYACRLFRLRGGAVCPRGLALRAGGLVLCVLLAVRSSWFFPLIGLPLFYFLSLCVNAAEAFALPRGRLSRRFAWGLLLFIGCDVCVGAWNLGLLGEFARVGMWLFYLPSQVLIVLSQNAKGVAP